MSVGIKNTREVVVFLAKVGVSTAQCAINKKFNISYFMDDLLVLPDAIADMKEIPAEIKDLDSTEGKELLNAVVEELAPLGLGDHAAAQAFIQAGIAFVEGTFHILQGVKELKKEDTPEVPETPETPEVPEVPAE